MTAITNCQHCTAETTNGLGLCELCQRYTETILQHLPIYYANLTRWRPGRAGSRPVPGSRVLYDGHQPTTGTGDRILDRLDETADQLTEHADTLADARPYLRRLLDRLTDAEEADRVDQAEYVTWLCKGFARHLTSLATLPWAGDFIRDLTRFEDTLRTMTIECVPGWYAGACRNCEAGTFAVPGLTWITCHGCGTTTYARDHLEVILQEAHIWVAPPRRIAEVVVALIDGELSVERLHKRIAKWGERDKIATIRRTDHDGDPIGPKRHQLGEVLDRLHSEGATRLGNVTTGLAS